MIFYFLLMGVGLLIAGKLIWGELRKEQQENYIKVLIPEARRETVDPAALVPASQKENFLQVEPEGEMLEDDFSGLSKLESILREKNIEIERLRSLLQTEMKHKLEYEKIKNLLQWQVFESRQMNREIQRELKSLQSQENLRSVQESKLRSELTYKDQLLLKKDYQLADLNMALQAFSLVKTSDGSIEKPGSSNASSAVMPVDPYEDWRNKN